MTYTTYPNAKTMAFDNSSNGFTATNLQDAIEESQSNPKINLTEVSSTGDVTTTSSSYVPLDSMTTTPDQNKYQVSFSTSVESTRSGASIFIAIFLDDTKVDESEIEVIPYPMGTFSGTSLVLSVSTRSTVTVNGSQAIQIRWKTTGGTATAHQRVLDVLQT